MSPKGDTADVVRVHPQVAEAFRRNTKALGDLGRVVYEVRLRAARLFGQLGRLVQPLAELEETERRAAAQRALELARFYKRCGANIDIQVVTMQSGGSRLVLRQLPRWSEL